MFMAMKGGKYSTKHNMITIADLTEDFIQGKITLDDALHIVQNQTVTYAKDATMQAVLSDQLGRVLIVEPGIGYQMLQQKYTVMTNDSLLKPEITRQYHVDGDDRYERTQALLERQNDGFSMNDAMNILKSVKQDGLWATRVSFVYSVQEKKVYYVKNNQFDEMMIYQFCE